ncbi:regucalcin-like [Periplaneta americana]|uniref:regucalcin-like n=1 Tax=Periplaneta americana TaxID=6978 RepID=UPI0037E919BE
MEGASVTAFRLSVLLLTLLVADGYHTCSHHKVGPTVTQVTAPVNHGEGPHWDAETGVLFFVDIASELVNKYDPATNEVTHAQFVGGGVTLVIPVKGTKTQQLLTTRGHDVILVNWNQQNATFDSTTNVNNVTVIATVETEANKSGNRWNDGKADVNGRLWAGTMGPEPIVGQVTPDQGAFYLLKPDTKPITEVTPVSISNGLAWNRDNTLLYYIDTATDQVDVFDFNLEQATISNRRKVFNLQENGVAGHPDGMTIDSNENLWIACFDGGQVINVNPYSGELIQSVPIPASRVTSAMFGGPHLDTLYVTTSRLGLSDEEQQQQPLAGSVFAITGLGVSALAPANNALPNLGKHK